MRKSKFSILIIILLITLSIPFIQEASAAIQPQGITPIGIDVQQPVVGVDIQEPQLAGNCVMDACGLTKVPNCTANDAQLGSVVVYDVVDHCEYAGDTGTYSFVVDFYSTGGVYDPYMFFALDGGDGLNGNCGYAYLRPQLITPPKPVPEVPMIGPSFYDIEWTPAGSTVDKCGDLPGKVQTYAITPYFTFTCTDGFLGGQMGYTFAWNQNKDSHNPIPCDSFNPNCPGTASKCHSDNANFVSLANPVDLSITKTAGGFEGGKTPKVDPGETFWYDITVTNNSTYPAHGYAIYDDLPSWLRPATDRAWFDSYDGVYTQAKHYPDNAAALTGYPDVNTGETLWEGPWGDGVVEYCSTITEGCNGFGDIIKIRTMSDLAAGASKTFRIYVTMWTYDATYCSKNAGDPRCSVEFGYDYPSTISNKACVWPYDRETTSAGCQDPLLCSPLAEEPSTGSYVNNCDIENVPTRVKLAYFTAEGTENGVTLKWETTNEINNMGFNIYRSTSPFTSISAGAVKLNDSLIPSANPGGNMGASYVWEDTTAKPGVKYYYWLEDVEFDGSVSLTGPVASSVLPKLDPIIVTPRRFILPGSRP